MAGPPTETRRRCATHNIAVGDDGRCLMCRRGDGAPAQPTSVWKLIAIITGVFAVGLAGYVVVRDLGAETTPAPDLARKPVVAEVERQAPVDRDEPRARAPRTKTAGAQRREREADVLSEMQSIPITLYVTDW